MNIWNKVLLGLIAVMLLPLFYFSTQALKTHQYWRSVANKIEAKLPTLDKDIERVKFGDPAEENPVCLQSVRVELYKYLVNRGRVWSHCTFQGVKNGQALITITKPNPAEIEPRMILYAFDDASPEEGGCLLGEFKVEQVDKKTNQITLALTMDEKMVAPAAGKRIALGQGSWTLREVLPHDTHEIFAGLSEAELRKRLPAQVVDEYLKDGKDGYVRKLRDYEVLLKELNYQRTTLTSELKMAKTNHDHMEAALADARKQELFRQDDRTLVAKALKKMESERDNAVAYEDSLKKELGDLEAKLTQLIQDNQAVAQKMAKVENELIRRIDRRTAMAVQ